MAKAGFLCALAAGGLLAGCSPFGGASVFTCETDSQCSPGRCLMPEGLCVFPDEANCGPGGESYGAHSGKSGECVGGTNTPDAPPIDAPTMCVANQKYCFQGAIETCAADGMGFNPAMKDQCAIECQEIASVPTCVGAASNIQLADQKACNATGTALALAPPSGTVTINDTDITCNPSCGTVTTIPRTASTPNNFFCLASITIPAGVTVTYNNVNQPITLFSSGNVLIDGTINFDGGNATGANNNNPNDDNPGAGGPGGFPGADGNANDNSAGIDGGGPTACAGKAGAVVGTGSTAAGGGGGGGANASTGGDGGDGRGAGAGTPAVAGGNGGTTTACSAADARPLVGGAGGASGGDGGCGQGNMCGWPGGGGGGALHIVSRTQISGAGTLSASGGNGYGDAGQPGGGGGGGAGGMILLEAPTLSFTGPLRVNGGNGGATNSGLGGAGGTGATATGANGSSAGATADRGGAGGGGGGGRIRVNATTGASCATASPAGAPTCTTSTLRTAP